VGNINLLPLHRSRGTLKVCVTTVDQNIEQLSSDRENIHRVIEVIVLT